VSATPAQHRPPEAIDEQRLRELVVCSLEPWDQVWRRNQFLTDELLRRRPQLRVLFVEPPSDVLFDLSQRRRPLPPRVKTLRTDERLYALRPLKLLPRRLGPLSDRVLLHRVIDASRRLGFTRPTLWLNDVTYAPLIRSTGWPAVYDVTDDWLLAPSSVREVARLRKLDELALAQSQEVVVCSPALATSRGRDRAVTLIPNGVDTEHLRRPRPRPSDLPPAPTAVYVGTLHEARLDVELVVELARALRTLSLVLVGPDALGAQARRMLGAEPNVHLLGARPYADVPAYLQHADVVLVPHRVTPFTESLDPIKAYECLALLTPTVATPVAGFRELADDVTIAAAESFVAAVRATLSAPPSGRPVRMLPSWADRARMFELVLVRANAPAARVTAA
jgi:glycosyltransferase involved in cell wall biosynthesis